MPEIKSQQINNFTETSTSSPKRTRPTDKQMGLGTHDFFTKKQNKTNNKDTTT